MAATHLGGGRDVVMPQYIGVLAAIERFEEVARDSGADFCEVVLMDTKRRSLERFGRRGGNGEPDWHRYVQEIVEQGGGEALLASMHDELTAVMAARPRAIVIPSTEGAIQRSYQALIVALGAGPGPAPLGGEI
jgi:hypothetical protein